MKYIFLLALLLSTPSVYAQETTGGTTNTSNSQTSGGLTNTSNSNSNTSGGLTNTSNGSASGGLTNTSSGQNSGGLTNTSNGQTTGGRTGTLAELQKPNLTVVGFVNWFIQIFNYIAILLFSAALVVFLYGIFLLMFVGGTNDESRSKGRKFMFWGIVSLFVMTSTWGLVNVLKSSIFGSTGALRGPQFK